VSVGPFLLVAIVVIVTPGVDTALVMKNALLHGRRPAVATALGVNVGIAFWTMAATAGLAAVVSRSTVAFDAIKLAGSAYLLYLGVRALLASRRRHRPQTEDRLPGGRLAQGAAFRQGLVSNLGNPKIAVMFTGLLPQFVSPHGPVALELLALGALFNLMGLVWLVGYAIVASRGRALLTRPRAHRALDRLSGVVLVGLAARLAVERR
jgi:threonine/homoserine/homoserine lactone efflux protein